MSRLYATVTPAHVAVRPGQRVVVELSLGNTSDLIDGFSVTVFGLDDGWRTVQPEQLSLFPGDTGIVAIEIHLPDGFPSGMRQLAVHVQSENDPTTFELVPVTLDVGAHPLLSLAVDPSQVTGGSTAQFGLVVTNHGNSIVDVIPDALDPEDLAEFEFAPVSAHLLPGEQAVFRAEVSARRPWVGQPAVRSLTFAACVPDKVESIATFVQRPRISRWLLSLLGLITAAAVFGAVLSHTLSGVVDEAKVSDALVNEALASGDSGGAQVSTSPATVNGTVVSASDAPIAGVQALLFESDNAEVPVASAATGADGKYAFTRLSGSTYRVKFTGAGFADQWYVDGRTFAEAKDVEVLAGGTAPLDPVTISGQPGGVSGRLIATDVTGATVRIVVPSQALAGGTAQVADVDVSADGSFNLPDLPTPATYTLVVERAGNATQTRTVILAPGEVIDDLEIRLVEGNGVINGRVSAGGQPLGGVAISATDGTTTVETVSITTQGDVGAFVIRGLAVPGRYTVTFTREGYSTESRSVALESPDPFPLDVNLSSSVGSISGAVNAATGGPLGGVAVTVTGGDAPVVTSTISQGSAIGSWSVDGLAAPGSYTVTFSRMDYVSQTRLVTLSGAGAATTGIDAALVQDTATVTGQVVDALGQALPLAGVELTDGVTTRNVKTADDPPGRFGLTGVAPGSYTLTISFTGATPEVQVVTVQAGETRDLQLQLGRQAAITGRVLQPGGAPYPNLDVRLYDPVAWPSTNPNVPRATTGADGSYTFTNIQAPADFVIAVYATTASIDALDAELIASVPGAEVVVPDFVIAAATATVATTTTPPAPTVPVASTTPPGSTTPPTGSTTP